MRCASVIGSALVEGSRSVHPLVPPLAEVLLAVLQVEALESLRFLVRVEPHGAVDPQ